MNDVLPGQRHSPPHSPHHSSFLTQQQPHLSNHFSLGPPSTGLDPTTSFQPQPSAVLPRRKRAMIACVHCRRRKMKCVTSEEPPRNPCARCTRRHFDCVYVAVVGDDYPLSSTSTPESPLSNPHPQADHSYPRTMPPDHYGGNNSAYSDRGSSSHPNEPAPEFNSTSVITCAKMTTWS
ncbi:hypothetical protein C8J57DRAFT_1410205 [Mycena rebaudengoi]|nr:hypothetical protein C8J57DRAFT_1410205 [Mycena rebaudengoi]